MSAYSVECPCESKGKHRETIVNGIPKLTSIPTFSISGNTGKRRVYPFSYKCGLSGHKCTVVVDIQAGKLIIKKSVCTECSSGGSKIHVKPK